MNFSPLRLRLASVAGVLAIIATLASKLLEPSGAEKSTTRAFALARAHQGAWFASNWAEIIGFTTAALLVVTVTGLVRGRGIWLTGIGGWLTTVSFLVIGLSAISLIQGVMARQPDQPAMIHTYDQIDSSGAVLPLLILALLSAVAPIVFTAGLWRAGLVGWWLPAVSVASVVLYAVLGGGDSSAVMGAVVQIPTCIQFAALIWIIQLHGARSAATVDPIARSAAMTR
jgi:hypothetical protein